MELTIKVTTVMQPRVYQKKDGSQGCTYQFVGETQTGQYDKTIHFQVFGEDRFNSMQLAEGGVYQVSFDIESRPWKDTYITSCTAWRAIRTDNVAPQPAPAPQTAYQAPAPAPQPAPMPMQPQASGDDLPF